MNEIVRLGATIYSYLKDNNDKDKNAKGTKKCHKKVLNFKIINTVYKQMK